jgi:hypothetical protein
MNYVVALKKKPVYFCSAVSQARTTMSASNPIPGGSQRFFLHVA